MKLGNFLMIALAVVFAGIAGAYVMCSGGKDKDDESESARNSGDDNRNNEQPTRLGAVGDHDTNTAPAEQPMPTPTADPTPTPTPTADPTPAPDDNVREVDRTLVAWAGRNLGASKVKDAVKGRPYKINLYQDSGKGSVNRAKVDLDRDGKWDEKWTFDGANISRKVAPADDEQYTDSYDWSGQAWVKR